MGKSGRPKKEVPSTTIEGEFVVATEKKQKKPTIEERIAALQAQADNGDVALGSAMLTVSTFLANAQLAKANYKLSARRLNCLVKGLSQ